MPTRSLRPLPMLLALLVLHAATAPATRAEPPLPRWRDRCRVLHRALSTRDPATGSHCVRTGELAAFLAPSLGLDPTQARIAGRVHDLGKLSMPDAILFGERGLSDTERMQVKLHPIHGRGLARSLGLPAWVVAAIVHHHERWDGAGYPDGIAGEAIEPIARVVSVADVIDAITSARSYKAPRPFSVAVEALEQARGSQLDPRVVAYALARTQELAAMVIGFRHPARRLAPAESDEGDLEE